MEHAGSYGQFQLLRYLSRGQVTEVFLARDPEEHGPDGLVVVERLLPEVARNPGFAATFLDEAGIAGTLKHPNIVQIYDLGEADGLPFVAMEYIRGGSLHELLDRRAGGMLPLGDALFVVGEVCAGLQYAHALAGPDGEPRNLVHRELNPRHILVSIDGVVKICDFGMASALEVIGVPPPGDPKEHRAYLSPEQLEGRPIDRRSDIYACGALLYRLATGELPGSPMDGTFVPPQQVAPDLPQGVVNCIIRAMAGEPKARHTTCGALRRDLIQAAKALSAKGERATLAMIVQADFPEVGGWGTTESQQPPPPAARAATPPAARAATPPAFRAATPPALGTATPARPVEEQEPSTARRLLAGTSAARSAGAPPPPPSTSRPPPPAPPGGRVPPPPPPPRAGAPSQPDGRLDTLLGVAPGVASAPPSLPRSNRDDTQRGLPQPVAPRASGRDDTERGLAPPPQGPGAPPAQGSWSQGTPSDLHPSSQPPPSAPRAAPASVPSPAFESAPAPAPAPSSFVSQMPSAEGLYQQQPAQPVGTPASPSPASRQEKPKRGLLVPILVTIIVLLLLGSGLAVYLLGPWSPLWDTSYLDGLTGLASLDDETDPLDLADPPGAEVDPGTAAAGNDGEPTPSGGGETPGTVGETPSGDQPSEVEVVGGGTTNPVEVNPPAEGVEPPRTDTDRPRGDDRRSDRRDRDRRNDSTGGGEQPPVERTPNEIEQPDPTGQRRSSSRTGRIYVLTAPYARVYLDSRLLGTTPS